MSYFYSLRGWLEVDPSNIRSVISVIVKMQQKYQQGTKDHLYMQGWCWSEKEINWTRYIFYGADVTHEGILLFDQVLNAVANIKAQVSGYFHAQGEDGEHNLEYRLSDDVWRVENSAETLLSGA